ncbi:polysaccharide biosynthesis/export family protein [Caulobacter hibisci]|uniref:polysaccharide biosynthesis/export family protein n=1 Tax=Caulobacter hibisci TaxID=2035993 RepID=UPI0018E361B9
MFLAVAVLVVTGCATQPIATAQAAQGPAQASSAAYQLGAGDKVRVQVFGEPDLSGEFQVSGEGKLSMPLIGDVKASGLSVPQLQAALTSTYGGGYLRDPKISIELISYRPYFILGEIEKPGRYPSTDGLTVLNAIATAGGFTYRANKKRLYLRREGESAERQITLDSDVVIRPGDVLRVPERHF